MSKQKVNRPYPLTILPKLTLPYRHKIPQDGRAQLFNMPSATELPSTSVPSSPQLQYRRLEERNHGSPQREIPLVNAEEFISCLDTVLMVAVKPGVSEQQQHIFVNTLVEDLTNSSTL